MMQARDCSDQPLALRDLVVIVDLLHECRASRNEVGYINQITEVDGGVGLIQCSLCGTYLSPGVLVRVGPREWWPARGVKLIRPNAPSEAEDTKKKIAEYSF